jgi:hypothetical protein
MPETRKALMIAGPLTEADVRRLLETMRAIERQNPTGLYQAVVVDLERDPSIEEMAERMERVFPRAPGVEVVVGYRKKRRPSDA